MIVEFYDPHPGMGGAAMALPIPLRLEAEKLNATKISLEEAVQNLKAILKEIPAEERELIVRDSFILIKIKCCGIIHAWRLISFKIPHHRDAKIGLDAKLGAWYPGP